MIEIFVSLFIENAMVEREAFRVQAMTCHNAKVEGMIYARLEHKSLLGDYPEYYLIPSSNDKLPYKIENHAIRIDVECNFNEQNKNTPILGK